MFSPESVKMSLSSHTSLNGGKGSPKGTSYWEKIYLVFKYVAFGVKPTYNH